MNVEHYVDKLDSPLKEIVLKLRRLITNHSVGIQEKIKWNVPTYSINKNICSIMAHKHHVNFQIFRGAHIQDAGELEGTGKDMRHLKFSTLDEIEDAKIDKYLKQALELG